MIRVYTDAGVVSQLFFNGRQFGEIKNTNDVLLNWFTGYGI